MNNHWHGRLSLITGASGGIGANIAEFLAAKGINVILVARNLGKLEKIANRINEYGGRAYIYQSDLTVSSNRELLIKNILNDIGIPDILINNAGVGWYGYFSSMPWVVARDLLELNITATAHITSILLPSMLTLPEARIINIGSIAGKLPEQGIAMYSGSKAYLDAFTTSLFRELRHTNVTASILRAGPVKTDFFKRASKLPEGGQIPGEVFAISPKRVANGVWRLIQHPSRFLYVPFYLALSPLLETLFSWALDLIGPLLLRISARKNSSIT